MVEFSYTKVFRPLVMLSSPHLSKFVHLSPIRLNSPTPQGFSATRDVVKATPSKAPKAKLMDMEKEAFQKLDQVKTLKEERQR
ncbi:Amino-acid acetyltransferase [Bienertia sinuspersici]